MAHLDRSPKKMTKKQKILSGIIASYAGLWAAGWLAGPKLLSRQLMADAVPRWQEWNSKRVKTVVVGGREIAVSSLPAYDTGPVVSVENVLSPFPLIFRADCTKAIHGLEGRRWIGWYFVTPWHAYKFSDDTTSIAGREEPLQRNATTGSVSNSESPARRV
jgi:hypothetical protein